MTSLVTTPAGVGGLLREWRQRRRLETVLIDEFAAVAYEDSPPLPMPQQRALRCLAEAVARDPGGGRPLDTL